MLKWLISAAAALALTACGGGGGDAGQSVFQPAPGASAPVVAASELVVESPATMDNTTSASVQVTVMALDASRNTVAQVPVRITVDNGAVVSTTSTHTDTSGKF